jgi:hypothetical protein
VAVAGPAALLVSKLHKIYERREDPGRLKDKDGIDVYRLLRAIPTKTLALRLQVLIATPLSSATTKEATEKYLPLLFDRAEALGCVMAARGLEPLESGPTVKASCVALTYALMRGLGRAGLRDLLPGPDDSGSRNRGR